MSIQYPPPQTQPRFDFDDTLPECEGRPLRDFRLAGTTWRVCEDRCRIRQLPCLIFYGPGRARRVFSYPPNWRSLSDGELGALSWLR